MPEFVWITAHGSKGENAAFLLEEDEEKMRIKWAVNGGEEWLFKDENEVVKDSEKAGRSRRGSRASIVAPAKPMKKKIEPLNKKPAKEEAPDKNDDTESDDDSQPISKLLAKGAAAKRASTKKQPAKAKKDDAKKEEASKKKTKKEATKQVEKETPKKKPAAKKKAEAKEDSAASKKKGEATKATAKKATKDKPPPKKKEKAAGDKKETTSAKKAAKDKPAPKKKEKAATEKKEKTSPKKTEPKDVKTTAKTEETKGESPKESAVPATPASDNNNPSTKAPETPASTTPAPGTPSTKETGANTTETTPAPKKKRKSIAPLEALGEHDVLCGRGGASNKNKGNISFRTLAASKQGMYLEAKKHDKKLIAEACVDEVYQKGGQFKKWENDEWVVVPRDQAIRKASQTLREGLDVKNKLKAADGEKGDATKDQSASQPTETTEPKAKKAKVTKKAEKEAPILLGKTVEQAILIMGSLPPQRVAKELIGLAEKAYPDGRLEECKECMRKQLGKGKKGAKKKTAPKKDSPAPKSAAAKKRKKSEEAPASAEGGASPKKIKSEESPKKDSADSKPAEAKKEIKSEETPASGEVSTKA